MQRELTCHQCGAQLVLLREGVPHYSWLCPSDCMPAIGTGVPTDQPLDQFEPIEGSIEFNASHFWPPLTQQRIRTAQVFMPQILYHFIECTRGGCYNALYANVIVPHLDSPEVVDYVLRSSVIHPSADVIRGKTGARIYNELLWRLNQIQSASVRKYLAENFSQGI